MFAVFVLAREKSSWKGAWVRRPTHVLDVAARGDLFEAGTKKCACGVTLLKQL
jgi:hypothetical protein